MFGCANKDVHDNIPVLNATDEPWVYIDETTVIKSYIQWLTLINKIEDPHYVVRRGGDKVLSHLHRL